MLNNNPIYRVNRYLHYLKVDRSLSVIKRTPDFALLEKYSLKFKVKINFFGSLTWCMSLLSKIIGAKLTANFSDWFDKKIKVYKSAFRFVMVAIKN